MVEELEIFNKLANAEVNPGEREIFVPVGVEEARLVDHRNWLKSIRHEQPSPSKQFKIGIYIRYFNQTKYSNYLNYHIKQYQETVERCPNWQLVDFYIDEGNSAPNMESAPSWSRLLQDCFNGKINLIITQKVSNVSKKPYEINLVARVLAAQNPPIGMYFVSEDIFTLASYYQHDLFNTSFFPDENWELLPDDEHEIIANLEEEML